MRASKKRFADAALAMSKAFTLCCTLDEAKAARQSLRAKLHLMVKRILRKHKYPPDQQDAAVALVLQQAEALAEDWL